MVEEGPPTSDRKKSARGPRNSTGMFVTGIVLVSGSGIAMLYMTAGMLGGGRDDQFTTGAIATALLAGAGIPLMVIGGRRKPAATVSVTPWVSPQLAGAGLRLDL